MTDKSAPFLALDIGGTFVKITIFQKNDVILSDQFATPSMTAKPILGGKLAAGAS